MASRSTTRSAAVISYTMSRIRSKNTSIELALRRALWARGLRYRIHFSDLPGSPDIVFTKSRVAIFCDSSFWHGRDWKKRKSKIRSNREYWLKKIGGNIARDRRVSKLLLSSGWKVLRFWDVEITSDTEACVQKVMEATGSLI
jgi:DNA mismatch endonuclease (patch repair protein)